MTSDAPRCVRRYLQRFRAVPSFCAPLVSYRTLVNLSNFLFFISRLICIYATFIFPPRSACDRYVRLTLAFRTTKSDLVYKETLREGS
jgi:hypothetical protein